MPRLWIDSNCARRPAELKQIALLARAKGVTIVIHAQVYLERRRQVHVKAGATFSAQRFDDLLTQLGVEVARFDLDQPLAAAWADTLYERYPMKDGWEAAKKRALKGTLRKGFEALPGDMPMTTDWLIALLVEADADARIVTEDSGEEWKVLRDTHRLLSWNEAIAWLEGLPPA